MQVHSQQSSHHRYRLALRKLSNRTASWRSSLAPSKPQHPDPREWASASPTVLQRRSGWWQKSRSIETALHCTTRVLGCRQLVQCWQAHSPAKLLKTLLHSAVLPLCWLLLLLWAIARACSGRRMAVE